MHKYSFHTVWTLPASPERCWHELVALRSWQLWWPAFQPEQPAGSGPARPGDQIALRVRSPLGYRLRLRLEITGVVPMRRLDVAGSGDLAGVGRADFEAAGSIGQPSTVLRHRLDRGDHQGLEERLGPGCRSGIRLGARQGHGRRRTTVPQASGPNRLTRRVQPNPGSGSVHRNVTGNAYDGIRSTFDRGVPP
jgi:hypothetical protein